MSLDDVFLGKSGLAAATASVIARAKSVLNIMVYESSQPCRIRWNGRWSVCSSELSSSKPVLYLPSNPYDLGKNDGKKQRSAPVPVRGAPAASDLNSKAGEPLS